jgi:hypothetical protein
MMRVASSARRGFARPSMYSVLLSQEEVFGGKFGT